MKILSSKSLQESYCSEVTNRNRLTVKPQSSLSLSQPAAERTVAAESIYKASQELKNSRYEIVFYVNKRQEFLVSDYYKLMTKKSICANRCS